MGKKITKTITDMGFKVYGINSVDFYITGGSLKNQINLKKVASGMFYAYGEGIEDQPATNNTILEMLG